MNKLLGFVLTLSFGGLVLTGCEEDELHNESPAIVQFALREETIKENESDRTIAVNLSKPSTQDGTINISFDPATSGLFATTPVSSNGVLALTVKKNDTSVSFKLIPTNDGAANGDQTIALTVTQVTSGLQVGEQKTFNLTIEDDDLQAKGSVVSFIASNATIKETNSEWHELQLHVSEYATANGSVLITVNDEKAIYGIHYITEPAVNDNTLRLSAIAGEPVVKFKIRILNNETINGDLHIKFRIDETTGNLKRGATIDESFNITDDELEGMPKGYETGGGSWGLRKRYEYNPDGSIAKIFWESNTPYYSSGTYTYSYNENNRLEKINTGDGQDLIYAYEDGRVFKESKVENGKVTRYTEYGYDEQGNVGSYRTFFLQPDGTFTLSFVSLMLYHSDNNLYKQLIYSPSNNDGELSLISTATFDSYNEKENPFPMVEILPGIKTQTKLPTMYRYEAGGKDLLYQLTYEYGEDGKVSKRIATGANTIEVSSYQYY